MIRRFIVVKCMVCDLVWRGAAGAFAAGDGGDIAAADISSMTHASMDIYYIEIVYTRACTEKERNEERESCVL